MKIGLTGCFLQSCKNLQTSCDNNDNQYIECKLKDRNDNLKDSRIKYNGTYLVNNNGNFEETSQNIIENRRIPKNIFRTFKNDYNEELKNSWIKNNHDYKYYFFNDDDCLKLIQENFDSEVYKTYLSLAHGAPRVDLWRCCVLYLYGGVYVDIDCECISSIDEIIKDYDFVVPVDTQRTKYALFNAFMASSPRNNILHHLINKIIYNTKNEIYIERHENKGDAFMISGPGALGEAFSELLNNPFQTLYEEGDIIRDIPYYNRIVVGKQDTNNYQVILSKNHKINNSKFYYSYGENTESNLCDIFVFDNSKIQDNIITIKRIDRDDGWGQNLDVAINYQSSITKTNVFYFGEYNYFIGNSDKNNLIIKIKHNEYKKLLSNSTYLNIDFKFKIKDNSSEIIIPENPDYFSYKIVSFDETNLYIELVRLDKDEGWGKNLSICIYYSSLLIETNLRRDELIHSKINIYDSYDYLKGNDNIEEITCKIIYKNEIVNNKLLITIQNYNSFIPIYTIINIIAPNPMHHEKQHINLLWHNQFPEFVSRNNKQYILSQKDQINKENIVESYTKKCVYIKYSQNVDFNNKRVCYICTFPYHYEMFYFLLQYDKTNDIFANRDGDKNGFIEYLEEFFNIKVKNKNDFNHENYDIVINHTDDNNIDCPNDKLIVIEHEAFKRKESNFYLSVMPLSRNKRYIVTPAYNAISIEEKKRAQKNKHINIIYFNNAIISYKNCNNSLLIKILINTLKKYSITMYYRNNDNIQNIIKSIKSKNIDYVNIDHASAKNLANYYKICQYSIIGDEHFRFSGNVGWSLSFGCKLLSSTLRKESLGCNYITCYDDIEELTPQIDYDSIFNILNDIISKNNKLLQNFINSNRSSLFFS